jgi:CheY-like chemotaxis protein/HPt (histidine-containing phosphotransfer) domain-containing protein
VLVVDDIPANLKVAAGLMLPFKVRADTCESGAEAIELVRKQPYDLIFMDHMMPHMDGLEATARIRELPNGREAPIVALTANAVSGVREMFMAHGMDDFLSKPIEPAKLEAMLAKWIPEDKHMMAAAKEEAIGAARPAAEAPAPAPVEASAEAVASATASWPDDEDDDYKTLVDHVIDGMDLVAGLERLGDDEELYLEVLGAFVQCTPPLLDKLRSPARESLGEYAVLVHGVKGSSLNVGADKVGHLAAGLEKAARAGDYETVAAGNQSFLETADKLMADLSDLLAEMNEAE